MNNSDLQIKPHININQHNTQPIGDEQVVVDFYSSPAKFNYDDKVVESFENVQQNNQAQCSPRIIVEHQQQQMTRDKTFFIKAGCSIDNKKCENIFKYCIAAFISYLLGIVTGLVIEQQNQ